MELSETKFKTNEIMKAEYKYKFSIVMAVYNVEPFIREAIDSIIAQDIGFEQNVQLILIDDGSKDNSGVICDEYAKKYPLNIIVKHKKNGGVSSARNAGLEYVRGRYVNFMDADDKLSPNALSSVYDFFTKHEEEVDLVSIPIIWFDGKSGDHILNYKYKKGSRIINLRKEYTAIQLSMASCFIKSDIAQKISFDTNLIIAEDAKEILKILLNKMRLGVVNNCKYLYRSRTTGQASALQVSSQKKGWYLNSLIYFTYETIKQYLEKIGYIPLFVQFTLMYDLQWKLKQANLPRYLLSDTELAQYKDLMYRCLKYIDDEIILQQKHISLEQKVFILSKKHSDSLELHWRKNDALIYKNNTDIAWLSNSLTNFDFIKIEKGKLILEGFTTIFGCVADEEIKVYMEINGHKIPCEIINRNVNGYAMDELLFHGIAFRLKMPISDEVETYVIKVFCKIRGRFVQKKNFRFGKFCPINSSYKNSYYYKDERVLFSKNAALYLPKCGRKGRIQREWSYLKELWKKGTATAKKAVAARTAYHLISPFIKKEIWLFADRVNKADDNGEALFRYVNSKKNSNIKTYFIIDKKSPDYNKIKKTGKVVQHFSLQHKLLNLFSTKIISSSGDDFIINSFHGPLDPYRDLMQKQQYIFLQHGVIMNDLSNWLNKYNKNIKGFVTSAKPEYDSILSYPYYYQPEQVWLTGLPRHDRLYDNNKKMVTIMPTWRKSLMGQMSPQTGVWSYKELFKQSDYFQKYNSLINNQRLINSLKEYGYKLNFMPHPTLMPHLDLFDKNDEVTFLGLDTEYRKIFAESSLIITDYSSVAFDFAYLRKPIIYFQFDKAAIFDLHIYDKGYFDYETDGFGEIEVDLDDLINRIIEYVENGCKIKDKYKKRIDKFFAFNDKHNCERVYKKIMALEK